MSPEENKSLARRYIEEVWGRGNYDLEQEILAPDFVNHNPIPGFPPNRTGHHQELEMFQKACPDMRIKVDQLIAEGDKVVDYWTATGTQTGEMMGMPASNKSFTMTGMDITRWENGKVKEIWHVEDMLTFMQQLGFVPMPGEAQQRAA